MTGTKVSFNRTGKSPRIRKTIPFDPTRDALILDYINKRVRGGECFASIVKELLLKQIALIQLASTYVENTVDHTTPQTEDRTTSQTKDSDFSDPFADLMK